jgi:hypothetical protein
MRRAGLLNAALAVCLAQLFACAHAPVPHLPSLVVLPPLQGSPDPTRLNQARAELEHLRCPDGVDPVQFAELRTMLGRLLAARAVSKLPSPQRSAVTDMQVTDDGAGAFNITWTYNNNGDYTLDGEVNISDLTPLAVNLGKTSSGPGWASARVCDGDGNGEVNLSDLTSIGAAFYSQVLGYYVYGAPGPDGPWLKLARVALESGVGTPPLFTWNTGPQAYPYYKVSPYDDAQADWLDGGGALVELGSSTEDASSSIDASGGTISGPVGSAVEGISVEVPAGAFQIPTQVSLGSDDGTVTPIVGSQSGPIIELTTDYGGPFELPLKVTVPFPGDANTVPMPYYIDPDGKLELCDVTAVDNTAGTVTFLTWHASSFVVLAAMLDDPLADNCDTGYDPLDYGFQIGNHGSEYSRGGECSGMAAWSIEWFRRARKTRGAFYPRYMYHVPGSNLVGQDVIATRAYASVESSWEVYYPSILEQNKSFTDDQEWTRIRSALLNTGNPVMLILGDPQLPASRHAVVGYAYVGSKLYLYDPNQPGQSPYIEKGPTLFKPYGTFGYQTFAVAGDGSLARRESFDSICEDADRQFESADSIISFGPDLNATYTQTPLVLTGDIESGELLVTELIMHGPLGNTTFNVDGEGHFEGALPLRDGENWFIVETRGVDFRGKTVPTTNNFSASKGVKIVADIEPQEAGDVIRIECETTSWTFSDPDIEYYLYEPDGGVTQLAGLPPFAYYFRQGGDGVQYGQEYKVRARHWSDFEGASDYKITIQLNRISGDTWESENVYTGTIFDGCPVDQFSNLTGDGSWWSQYYSFTPHMLGQ